MADYTTRALTLETWEAFADLVERNRGIWGGCWCLGFHPNGPTGDYDRNREKKRELVASGRATHALVFDGETCVGWCQYGRAPDLLTKNPAAYARELDVLPDWRLSCIFTDSKRRGHGVARAAVGGALAEIARAGGGVVEAYPEQQEGRPPQRGAYFHTGPESLYAGYGFERMRRIAKWRWVMRRTVEPSDASVLVPSTGRA